MKSKRILMLIIVAILAAVMCSTLVACVNDKIPGADVIIMIDLGAQVEIVLDNNGKVITVNALNEDGEVLLIDTKLDGHSYKTSVHNLITLAINMGFINNLNNIVYIDSICVDDDEKVLLNRELFNVIKGIDKNIEVKTYNYNVEKLRYRSFINNIDGLENLSFLQYRLIMSIMQTDNNTSLQELIKLDTKGLTIVLVNLYKDNRQYGSNILGAKLREKIKVEQNIVLQDIMALQSENTKKLYNSCIELDKTINKIMNQRNNRNFIDTEIEIILAKIDIVAPDKIAEAKAAIGVNENGKVVYKVKAISNYLETKYLGMNFSNDTQKNQFERKLDNARVLFEPLYITLSAEEKTQLFTSLNGQVEQAQLNKISKIDQIYSLNANLKSRLEFTYNNDKALLADEIIIKLNEKEKEYMNTENLVKEKNKDKIDAEIVRLRDIKEKRLENYAKQG